MLPSTPVSSYPTLSPFTPTNRGSFTLCCTCRHSDKSERPDVIRLAALWCSDFPLSHRMRQRLPGAPIARLGEYSKILLNGESQDRNKRLPRDRSICIKTEKCDQFSRTYTSLLTAGGLSRRFRGKVFFVKCRQECLRLRRCMHAENLPGHSC